MATGAQVDALLLVVCAALTLLVVPGVAFFIGGLGGRVEPSRAFLFALTGTAVVVILGVAGGSGMLTGPPLWPHILGRPDPGLAAAATSGAYDLARAGSLLVVCAAAVSIVGVAVSSRLTLRAWIAFCMLWCLVVLFPLGYAVFALDDGWAVAGLGVIDFGGALLFVAAGASAAGALLACGRPERADSLGSSTPRQLPLVTIGGAFLWLGWLGLTTGSEGALDDYTALIAVNSVLASAGGCLMWMLVDRVLLRRPTVVSAFCGAFSGLVAITAGSGVLTLGWSLLVGALAALACATMVDVAARARFGSAMTLIVIVTVAGLVGLLFVGLFASVGGMVESGNFDLFSAQGIAGFAVLIGGFLISLALALAVRVTLGLTGVGSDRFGYGVRRGLPHPERDHPAVPVDTGAEPPG